jgi:hypothetical protein
MTETLTAEQIVADDRRRHEVLRSAQREAAVEAKRREREYRASLPRAAYDAAALVDDPRYAQPGRAYVRNDEHREVFDGQRVWILQRGIWAEEWYARKLGLDGEAVALVADKPK